MAQSNPVRATSNTSPTLDAPATWEGGPPIVHQNVALIECVSTIVLDEILKGTALKNYIVRQISATCIAVDQLRTDEIIKFLTKRGYEPKVIK